MEKQKKFVKRKRKFRSFFLFLLLLSLITAAAPCRTKAAQTSAKPKTRWVKLRERYKNNKNTDRLIFVKYKGNSKATLIMYKKVKQKNGTNTWKKILSCKAYVGDNGIYKQREGDLKTPAGTYPITSGFGIKKNPGTKIPYTRLNRYLFWSGERDTYNTMVDCRKLNRTWIAGEHLIDYKPYYHYALAIGYNRKGIYKKGAAIFLHVMNSNKPYTSGCVAVPEKSMVTIMKNTTKKTKICIYPY